MPDWTWRRSVHESRHSLQAALASHTYVLLMLLMQSCFSPICLSFYLPANAHATLSCRIWSRCHHPTQTFPVACDRACLQVWCWCVFGSVFALTPHQRHSQLPQCIITMPSGQWKGTLQCEKEITFGGIYSNRSEVEEGEKTREVRMWKWEGVGWKMQLPPLRNCQQVNGRFAMSWYPSGWKERERWRHLEWHSDGFLTAISLLGPILYHVSDINLPVYLFIFLISWCCK